MTLGRETQERLLRLFTAACLLVAGLRLAALAMSGPLSWDLQLRHNELRLLEQFHYPREDLLLAAGIVSPANTVYPPHAFPWLWLLAPFADFGLNQLWHGVWSLAALAVLLRFAWGVGAPLSRPAGWACMSGTLALAANFSTFRLGQYGLIQMVLMLGATLALYRGHSARSGLLFGITLFKPTNAALMTAVFLRERRFAALAVAALVVTASAVAVGWWSGHSIAALLAITYPPGGMRFTADGTSLVTLVAAWGVPPREASLLCAMAGFAVLFGALRWVDGPRDPLLVLALTGFVTRISLYHRPYDDLLLVFLLLALFRLWIVAPSWRTTAVTLALTTTLHLPSRLVTSQGAMLAMFAVWTVAVVLVLVEASRGTRAERRC